jgi:hypothetical protein
MVSADKASSSARAVPVVARAARSSVANRILLAIHPPEDIPKSR